MSGTIGLAGIEAQAQDSVDASGELSGLDLLEQALQGERRALLEHDIDALVRSTADKLRALRAVEAVAPSAESHRRVFELSELNRANGALLARRRREVTWALRQLGRTENALAYDARGRTGGTIQARALGVG